MRKPPLAVIVVAVLLLVVGPFGLYGDVKSFTALSADHYDILWPIGVHLLAILAGIFLLLGHNWARWLAILWMAFHVAISYPSIGKILGHSAFLLLFILALFVIRPSRIWFRPTP